MKICFEINRIKANNLNVDTDSLVSNMAWLIRQCDVGLMETEENIKKTLLVSQGNCNLGVVKFDREKKYREKELDRSFQSQETQNGEKFDWRTKLRRLKDN